MKTILVAVGALVLLAGTFGAGMAYENHRIKSALEDAFSGFGDDSSSTSDDGSSTKEDQPKYGDPIAMNTATQWVPDPDSPGVSWTVTVTGYECGTRTLPKAAENPEWLGSDDVPRFIDAKAAAGDVFCVVDSTWLNSGKEPATLEPYDTMSELVLDDSTEMAASDEDQTITRNLTGDGMGTNLNPGKSLHVRNAYTVADGSAVTAVSLKPYAMMSSAGALLFALG